MNVLNITISSTTILIVICILTFMAVIGYYADKTKYSKEYKKKMENKNNKKIDLGNTRINDLVGEKKEKTNNDEEVITSNEEINNVNEGVSNPTEEVIPQELFEPLTNQNNDEKLKPSEEEKDVLTFDDDANQDELVIENPEEKLDMLTFDDENEQQVVESKEEEVVEVEQPVVEEPKEEKVVEVEQPVVDEPQEEKVVEVEQPVVEEPQEEKEVEVEQPVVEEPKEEKVIEVEQPVVEEPQEETLIEIEDQPEELITREASLVEDDFELDKELEQKLKNDILESIKTVEEQALKDFEIKEYESTMDSSTPTTITSLDMDDDFGIDELPKLKIDKESNDDDKLSVDDIFKI